jgi:predicted unusual protein kinase regulating ubiquinone biosynthesis (AarF/ABC1/UbiB family)
MVLKHRVKQSLGAQPDEAVFQEKMATALLEGMVKLRGTALKFLQLLSLDDSALPDGMKKILAKSQYSVPPMSPPLAVKVFTNDVGHPPDKVFDKFNPVAFRAASLGQVHEAWIGESKFAVKIQYPGAAESIATDIKIAKQLVTAAINSMPKSIVNVTSNELEPYFKELESRLIEETDYRMELQNGLFFREQCEELDGIFFPRFYPEFSGRKVLTMDFIQGQHLNDFMTSRPSIELKTKVAQTLYDYYEFQLHVLQTLNSDTHPGNFLITDDGDIGMLDFGSVKRIPFDVYKNFILMSRPDFGQDVYKAQEIFFKLGFLLPTDNDDEVEKLTRAFIRMFRLGSLPFDYEEFNFNNQEWQDEIIESGMELKGVKHVRGNKDLLFVSRTYFGLFAILKTLDVPIKVHSKYRKASLEKL